GNGDVGAVEAARGGGDEGRLADVEQSARLASRSIVVVHHAGDVDRSSMGASDHSRDGAEEVEGLNDLDRVEQPFEPVSAFGGPVPAEDLAPEEPRRQTR